jgi:hypothetical protein
VAQEWQPPDVLHGFEFGRRQRVRNVDIGPGTAPRIGLHARDRLRFCQPDRHDGDRGCLRVDIRQVFTIEQRAHGIWPECEIQVGDVFGRRVALGAHGDAGQIRIHFRELQFSEPRVGRYRHEPFEQ